MWRCFAVVAISAVALVAADASSSGNGLGCGAATPVDRSAPLGRAVPVRSLLWLGVYPYSPGYPTKAVVMAQHRLRHPILLRGWNCATGRRVRFWYGEGVPFDELPTSPAALRTTGRLSATFGPWPAQGMRGGYLMFWRSGLWKISAYEEGRRVGSAIVRAASG